MASGPEKTKVQGPVIREAERLGMTCRKLKWEGRSHAPDYFVAYLGVVVLLEFKAPGEKPRPAQLAEHRELIKNVVVRTVDSAFDGIQFIREMKEKADAHAQG